MNKKDTPMSKRRQIWAMVILLLTTILAMIVGMTSQEVFNMHYLGTQLSWTAALLDLWIPILINILLGVVAALAALALCGRPRRAE